jgi:hypothetical protein
MRYYPEDKADRELSKAKAKSGTNVIHKCLEYLTEFIYEKLAVKKKRAVDDIRAFCNLGLKKDKDWKEVNEDLKDYIYYYFNSKFAKEARRKEDALEKEKNQMLKTIGQLTLERDFLQDCFRRTGRPVPQIDPKGQ